MERGEHKQLTERGHTMKKALKAKINMTVIASKEKGFNNTAQIEKEIATILRKHGYRVGNIDSYFEPTRRH